MHRPAAAVRPYLNRHCPPHAARRRAFPAPPPPPVPLPTAAGEWQPTRRQPLCQRGGGWALGGGACCAAGAAGPARGEPGGRRAVAGSAAERSSRGACPGPAPGPLPTYPSPMYASPRPCHPLTHPHPAHTTDAAQQQQLTHATQAAGPPAPIQPLCPNPQPTLPCPLPPCLRAHPRCFRGRAPPLPSPVSSGGSVLSWSSWPRPRGGWRRGCRRHWHGPGPGPVLAARARRDTPLRQRQQLCRWAWWWAWR